MKIIFGLLLSFCFLHPSKTPVYYDLNDQGLALQQFYLGLNVENLWIAGSHINWETGIADRPDAGNENHTHCSAFVAAACKKMGVYILRPPEHRQALLANAQFDWLKSKEAQDYGWKSVPGDDPITLYKKIQVLANEGNIVVAIIKNPDDSKPGHSALIMPKKIEVPRIEESGPIVIMAGKHNFNYISLKNGFNSHLTQWPETEIYFYVNKNGRLNG